MRIVDTPLEGLKILEPRVFEDERGYFFESFNQSSNDLFKSLNWVQDNESKSTRGVLRGLHYQTGEHAQAKLVRSVVGEIYDVVVDIRKESKTYGNWFGIKLTGENKKQLLIPRGFAHGFLVLSEEAIFSYKCDNFYNKESEGGIIFNDSNLKIEWPIVDNELIISHKDKLLPEFGNHKPM